MELKRREWREWGQTPETFIEDCEFVLPTRPGWGVEVNEAAVRARPPGS